MTAPSPLQPRSLFENSTDILWEVDAAGVYNYCSPNVSRILGYPLAEFLGHRPFDFMPPEDARRCGETFRGFAAKEKPFSLLAHTFRRKDGTLRLFECSAEPVFDAKGEFHGFRGISRDVTERDLVRAAGAAGESAKREETLTRAGSRLELLDQMAHEVRHALGGIAETSGLMLAGELSPEQRRLAETLEHAQRHLAAVIESLLERAHADGKNSPRADAFSLSMVVRDALSLFAAIAQRKGLEIRTEIAADVPLALRGDPGALARVLTHLSANALKHSDSGPIVLRIINEADTELSAILRFELQDQGPGLSPAIMRQVFEPSPGAPHSGLSTSRELLAAMGGELGVETRPGKGSTFWFLVPFFKQTPA